MGALKKGGRILVRGMGKLGVFFVLRAVMSVIAVFTILSIFPFGLMSEPFILVWLSLLPIDPRLVLPLGLAIGIGCGGLAWLFHKLDEAVYWEWI
jgi:hypothetical protein